MESEKEFHFKEVIDGFGQTVLQIDDEFNRRGSPFIVEIGDFDSRLKELEEYLKFANHVEKKIDMVDFSHSSLVDEWVLPLVKLLKKYNIPSLNLAESHTNALDEEIIDVFKIDEDKLAKPNPKNFFQQIEIIDQVKNDKPCLEGLHIIKGIKKLLKEKKLFKKK